VVLRHGGSRWCRLQVGVPSDRIRIRYCHYQIRIRTQPSDTDTNIDRCEKMISVNRISDMDWILADRM